MLNITNEQILDQIARQGSAQGAARALGISWQTVNYARQGLRKGPKLKVKTKADLESKGVRLCSCCGQAPVAEGMRWLCLACWQLGESGEISPELNVGYLSR